MKKLIILLTIAASIAQMAVADGQDTLWYRTAGAGVQELDFTPDDKYVIAWTPSIEFWEVEEGVKEFAINSSVVGDYNYNNNFLVFAQDSTPKLLNWQTREVVEGFEKVDFKIERIKTAKSRSEFMSKNKDENRQTTDEKFYFWDIDSKSIVDSFDVVDLVDSQELIWVRSVLDYGYLGNNDEYFYVKYSDYNGSITPIPPSNRQTNDFYHIYDRETKELRDSVFRNQGTHENKGNYVDKLIVMNDRSKVAWNDEGGVINFYQFDGEKFNLFDNIIFDYSDVIEASDISYSADGSLFGVTNAKSCCRYLKIYSIDNKKNVLNFNSGGWSWNRFSISRDNQNLIASPGSSLVMYDSFLTTSIVELGKNNTNSIMQSNILNGILTINVDGIVDESSNLSLIDSNGKVIYAEIDYPFGIKMNYNINLSHLPIGVYFLRLETKKGLITNKIIKE